MAGDEVMKNTVGLPRGVVWLAVVLVVFVGFNFWLMRQVDHIVGKEVPVKRPVAIAAAVPAGARVPVIDRENDLLAPVTKAETPQIYLKRLPQKNTDEKEYGLPQTGTILTD
jgi:hypothetical protein